MREEHAPVGAVPQEALAARRQLGDGQHGVVDGAEEVAARRRVDKGDARAEEVREDRGDRGVVAELADGLELGQAAAAEASERRETHARTRGACE